MAKRNRKRKILQGMKVVYDYRGERTVGSVIKVYPSTNKAKVKSPRGNININLAKLTPFSIGNTLESIREDIEKG